LGLRAHDACAVFDTPGCYWRTLFHHRTSGGAQQRAGDLYQACCRQFRSGLDALLQSELLLRGYGYHLIKEPPPPTDRELSLRDPDRLFAFLDTNILLHGKWFLDLDWPTILGVRR